MILRAAVIDVETTGLSQATEAVVELAIVLFSFDPVSGKVLEELDAYCGFRDPGRPIPPDATAKHGIRDEDVRGQKLDEARIRGILGKAHYLIAHNAAFDRGFVERLFPETKQMPWLCSMDGIAWRRKGFLSKGLQSLLAAHKIAPGSAHRALDDARATMRLLATEKPGGGTYLQELLPKLKGK